MKRGFILTENEKERISNIYKIIISEAKYPPPTDVGEIQKFQDWMDDHYPNWVKGKNLNGGGGYGNLGKNTRKAWAKHGDEYMTKKGSGGDAYVYWNNGQKSKEYNLEDFKKEIDKGTVKNDTYVSKKTGGAWVSTKKLSEYPELAGPVAPPGTNPVNAPAKKTTQPTDSDFIRSKNASPENATSPFDGGDTNTFQMSVDGFKNWFEKFYHEEIGDSVTLELNPKKGTMLATDAANKKQLIYVYNDDLKTWNIPTTYTAEKGMSTITVVKKPAAPTTTTTTAAPKQ